MLVRLWLSVQETGEDSWHYREEAAGRLCQVPMLMAACFVLPVGDVHTRKQKPFSHQW